MNNPRSGARDPRAPDPRPPSEGRMNVAAERHAKAFLFPLLNRNHSILKDAAHKRVLSGSPFRPRPT